MKEKPKFKVGQVFEQKDGSEKTTWTIKAIYQVVEYPSGKHCRFNYKIEQNITFKDGNQTGEFVFEKSEVRFMELLKPEEKHWYSIG